MGVLYRGLCLCSNIHGEIQKKKKNSQPNQNPKVIMANSMRANELRRQIAEDKAIEERGKRETQMKGMLQDGVMRAVRGVEETVENQIRALEEVENMGDDELEVLRERRIKQMKEKTKRHEALRALGHGEYRTCVDEKDFFAQAKQSDKMVVHFGRTATRRCEIVDGHLQKLASKHVDTKFVRVEAEKSPFLADKLHIQVLPSIVLVKNGKTDHTLVGFEELGNTDDFSTGTLEKILAKYGMVTASDEHASRFGKSSASGPRSGTIRTDDWEE